MSFWWMWFCFLCFGLVDSRMCAENIVGLATLNQIPRCESNCNGNNCVGNIDPNAAKPVVEEGRSAGLARAQEEEERERQISLKNISIRFATPEFHHYNTLTPDPDQARFFINTTRDLYVAKEISKTVAQRYNLPKYLGGDILTFLQLPVNQSSCLPVPECNFSYPYRTMNGTCNNINNPTWGMSGAPFTRVLPSKFDDGIHDVKKSVVDGSPLPSERVLRTLLIKDADRPNKSFTILAMSWGQVLTHDIISSLDNVGYGGVGSLCCTEGGQFLPEKLVSRNCIVVSIPPDDEVYGPFNKTCMSVQRDNKTFSLNCRLSAAEDINQATSYIDASLVYGSSLDFSNGLRTLEDGLLRVTRSEGREMLPPSPTPEECARATNETCYGAGDFRVNQNVQLTVLQTILLRTHNGMARNLKSINPSWNDEKLFQESRRILIAMFQHIAYNELLPVYLGSAETTKYGLQPKKSGYDNGYNPKLNAMALNSFAAAAFRPLHGIIQGTMKLLDESQCPLASLRISDWMQRPKILVQPSTYFDGFIRGFVDQPMQDSDEFTTKEVTDDMFRRNEYWGQDLGALDISRGRDRGLPSYNDFRELCGLRRARKFTDLRDFIKDKHVQIMSRLYKSVEDVELYVAAFLERPVPHSLFGPTFQCIVREQFYRSKYGDRFYYEFPSAGFTPAQLKIIRQTTMSSLLCQYGNNITQIQPRSFVKISLKNRLQPCSSIPKADLKPWKE